MSSEMQQIQQQNQSEERNERQGAELPQEVPLESTTDQTPMSKEEQQSETVLIRCLKTTRWVVVSLVILVTAAAIGRGIMVTFRHIDLYVGVPCGTVGMAVSPEDGLMASINFTLRLYNPSGRAGLRYVNITFELFGNGTTTSPGQHIIGGPYHQDTWVGTRMAVDLFVLANFKLPQQFAGLSNPTTDIGNMTVKIDGFLQTRITGLKYTHGHQAMYFCSPLAINPSKATVANDTSCRSMRYQGEPTPPIPSDEGTC